MLEPGAFQVAETVISTCVITIQVVLNRIESVLTVRGLRCKTLSAILEKTRAVDHADRERYDKGENERVLGSVIGRYFSAVHSQDSRDTYTTLGEDAMPCNRRSQYALHTVTGPTVNGSKRMTNRLDPTAPVVELPCPTTDHPLAAPIAETQLRWAHPRGLLLDPCPYRAVAVV
jgi:hypothetical protein